MHSPTNSNDLRLAIVSSHIDKSLQFEWYEEALKNKGIYHIHIIISQLPREPYLVKDLQNLGIEVYTLRHKNFLSLFTNTYKTIRLFRKHNINLVHTTLPYGNLVGQTAAILRGIGKRVTTCENVSWAYDFKSKKQWLIDTFTFRVAKKVIFVADSAVEYAHDHWKIAPQKINTIYHGLKQEVYENISAERINTLKEKLGVKPGDFIVGMIARMEFWKGHKYAIEAMQRVVAKDPSIKLFIFGSQGPDYEKIMSQIKNLHLEDHVFYKGFINDPVALFQIFDVHLHVPINKYVENCGISIIEGMVSARPQILTLSGYAAQSAKNKQNALVVDYCNAEAIAEAILNYRTNAQLAKSMAAQAKTDALASYSNEVKLSKHLDLYNSLS
jgi:glycosyltransferase involved in cell wall biosynthesis